LFSRTHPSQSSYLYFGAPNLEIQVPNFVLKFVDHSHVDWFRQHRLSALLRKGGTPRGQLCEAASCVLDQFVPSHLVNDSQDLSYR
jgi:hypothetical protein